MKRLIFFIGIILSLYLFSCGGDEPKPAGEVPAVTKEEPKADNFMDNKGIGPIKQITLNEVIDEKMVAEGKQVYKEKCISCHKEYDKYIGPAPAGIMERRSPEWIMNMILNPEEMTKSDPIAQELFKQYLSPMANQHLTEKEARSVLEYFRTLKEE
jgi:mono/diheme cytochrome c family protein